MITPKRIPRVPLTFAEPGFRQRLETAPNPLVELYLVTEGRLQLEVGSKTRVLQAGDLALANAHFGNRGTRVAGPFRYGCLSLQVPDEPRFANWRRAPLLLGRRAPDPQAAQRLFREAAHLYHGPERPYRDLLLKAAMLQLLATAADAATPRRSLPDPLVSKALEFMSGRGGDPDLSLPRIARRVGVSPSHLGRLFQSHLGRSPMRTLVELRVRHAQGLLQRSSLTIKEIAYLVGFRDQLYFSRVFRRESGLAPREFRRASA